MSNVLSQENVTRIGELNKELGDLQPKIAELQSKVVELDGFKQRESAIRKEMSVLLGVAVAKSNRGRPRTKGDGSTSNKVKLPVLLTKLATEAQKPLKLAELTDMALAAGYESKATDFSNMVMQSLTKLVKEGVLVKDNENRTYVVKAVAA